MSAIFMIIGVFLDRETITVVIRTDFLDDETITHIVYSVSFTFDKTFDEILEYRIYIGVKGFQSDNYQSSCRQNC